MRQADKDINVDYLAVAQIKPVDQESMREIERRLTICDSAENIILILAEEMKNGIETTKSK